MIESFQLSPAKQIKLIDIFPGQKYYRFCGKCYTQRKDLPVGFPDPTWNRYITFWTLFSPENHFMKLYFSCSDSLQFAWYENFCKDRLECGHDIYTYCHDFSHLLELILESILEPILEPILELILECRFRRSCCFYLLLVFPHAWIPLSVNGFLSGIEKTLWAWLTTPPAFFSPEYLPVGLHLGSTDVRVFYRCVYLTVSFV